MAKDVTSSLLPMIQKPTPYHFKTSGRTTCALQSFHKIIYCISLSTEVNNLKIKKKTKMIIFAMWKALEN